MGLFDKLREFNIKDAEDEKVEKFQQGGAIENTSTPTPPEEDEAPKDPDDCKCCGSINDQVFHELQNERLYQHLAWCASQMGLPHFANYLYEWSIEEKEHANRFANFLIVKETAVEVPPIDCKLPKFDCICDITEAIYQAEKATTERIRKIYKVAFDEGHFDAVELASGFLKEQVEEERVALSLVKLWDMCDNNKFDFDTGVLEIKERLVGNVGKVGINY